MAEKAKARARKIVTEEPPRETLTTIPGTAEIPAPAWDGDDVNRLQAVLDTMDERITLLLARHEQLAERYAEVAAARQEAEEQLSRFASGALDPRQLEERVRGLESENDRLSRHASYLEERVESLLARVRYVVE